MWSKAASRTSAAVIVGWLATMVALLLPAGANAAWGQWVEAQEVTETTATVAMYIHPRWPETHWALSVFAASGGNGARKFPCPTKEPERCDFDYMTFEQVERFGTVVQKSPYEVVEVDVTIPGPLYQLPLQPAKAYELTVVTYGEGQKATAPEIPKDRGNDSGYEYFETLGALGPEEQADKGAIEKERSRGAKRTTSEIKAREAIEWKLARLREKSEHFH